MPCPRMIRFPVVLDHNIKLLLRDLTCHLNRECIRFKLRFDFLFATRHQRGYQNCWKSSCSLARQVLRLELLFFRIRSLKENILFPRAGMTVPHGIHTIIWPTPHGQNNSLISQILGIFRNNTFETAGHHLRRNLFRVSRSLKRCYYHINYPPRKAHITTLIMRPDLGPSAFRLPNGLRCEVNCAMPMFPPALSQPLGTAIILDVESSGDESDGGIFD